MNGTEQPATRNPKPATRNAQPATRNPKRATRNLQLVTLATLFLLLPLLSFAQDNYEYSHMWPALQQPWYFDEPNGIAIDDKDFVYVADSLNHQVQKFTSDGKFVTKWGRYGIGDGEFDLPYGVAADRMGFVYVTDWMNRRIQKFTSAGRFVAKWQVHGLEKNGSLGPSGIAADSIGYIYVAVDDGNVERNIQKFTTDGKFVRKWDYCGARVSVESRFYGIAVDNKGFVYAADAEHHSVQKFTMDGIFVTQWSQFGTGTEDLNWPSGIAVDRSGNVYVSDKDNNRVQKFDANGAHIKQIGSMGSGNGEFDSPSGIAVNRNGTLYVADWNNSRIELFTADGVFMDAWGNLGNDPGEFKSPEGMVLDGLGNIYVVDKNNNRIQKFTIGGQFLAQLDGGSIGTGPFDSPVGITMDAPGNIYLADTRNHRVLKFQPDGTVLNEWGTAGIAGNGDDDFNRPLDITVADGYVYVTDWLNQRVKKYDILGNPITHWGSHGSGLGEFDKPAGIAADSQYVYVTDQFNANVQRFNADGTSPVRLIPQPGDVSGVLNSPTGIAVTDSHLFVADTLNFRIKKYDKSGMFVTEFGEFGTGPGQLKSPAYLCVDAEGRVYVSDNILQYENNRVTVFRPTDPSAQVVKSIVVAGGGPYPGNNLWDATGMCANFAYHTLTYQGLSKETIYYLSADTLLDLDNNGLPDDVDGSLSNANLEAAITQWAAQDPPADRLVIYLADHGAENAFRMNGSETLTASELRSWIDRIDIPGVEVMVVYDACKSGSFIPELAVSNKNVTTITGASGDQDAYFIGQGTVSFSNYFWTTIFNGQTLDNAFDSAFTAIWTNMGLQTPMLDGNVDGMYIGEMTGTVGSVPDISDVSYTLSGSTAAFSAVVTDADNVGGISRVWAVIIPPGFTSGPSDIPVLELPAADLKPTGDADLFSGTYDGFHSTDSYSVYICAMDTKGNTAITQTPLTITVGNPPKRRAILVAGVSANTTELEDAYNALVFQGYSDDDIFILSPPVNWTDGEVEPTLENLASAFAQAGENTKDVVVFLIGDGAERTFSLNSSEGLIAATLDSRLDALQHAIPGVVAVVMDSECSGNFLSLLTPPQGKERIVVSGTSGGEAASGTLSFSDIFWRGIHAGETVGNAFSSARATLGFFTAANRDLGPQLDDNGNGVGNEISDGGIARDYVIGLGIRLGQGVKLGNGESDSLTILPSQNLSGTSAATIQATNFVTDREIGKVWAVITPPDFGLGATPVNFPLGSANTGIFQGTYTGFTAFGEYRISVYATDERGETFLHGTISARQLDGPDAFEPDNSSAESNHIVMNDVPQLHSFHHAADADWVSFYAFPGENKIYTIEANEPGNPENNPNVDIALYDADGSTLLSQTSNGVLTWEFQREGIYHSKITPGNSGTPAYDLVVYPPIAVFPGYLKGMVTDMSGMPISDAIVKTNTGNFLFTHFDGRYRIVQEPASNVIITVTKDGYQTLVAPGVAITEGGTTVRDLKLTPLGTQPVAVIDSPIPNAIIREGESLLFFGSVINGDAPFSFYWDFGNGQTSDVEDPGNIRFETEREYSVTFTVTDKDGDQSVAAIVVKVIRDEAPESVPTPTPTPPPGTDETPDPPKVQISFPNSEIATIYGSGTIRFQGVVSEDNANYAYSWKIDGVEKSVLKNSEEFTFSNDGSGTNHHEVSFEVTDTRTGKTAADSVTVTVKPANGSACAGYETRTGRINICVAISENAASIDDLKRNDVQAVLYVRDRAEEMPAGYLDMNIGTNDPGSEVMIIVTFSEALPPDAVWCEYNDGTCHDYSEHAVIGKDGKTITLALKDGGYGDTDGTANGVVTHSSGYRTGRPTHTFGSPPSDDVGTSNCFVGSLFGE